MGVALAKKENSTLFQVQESQVECLFILWYHNLTRGQWAGCHRPPTPHWVEAWG